MVHENSAPNRDQAFVPLNSTLRDVKERIPPEFFDRNIFRSSGYLLRDICLVAIFFLLATWIEPFVARNTLGSGLYWPVLARSALWLVYWWFQGLAFTGLWVMGHECGHGAFSSNKYICDILGSLLHTALLTPYWSWKYVHRRHHSNHASLECDEVYIPHTRSELGLPQPGHDDGQFEEYFGDTPIYTMLMLVRQQVLAFPAYLWFNASGQKSYPRWSNHFNPNGVMFSDDQRLGVVLSDIAMISMAFIISQFCATFGWLQVLKFYGIPWLAVNHWFVMITYLHHSDPVLPHYRKGVWNFQRGAAATIDRDFLGWQGRFFLHDVAHFHVVHHFFPKMPWYHGEAATGYLRHVLGPHYHHSSLPVFKVLWHNYTVCQFIDDEGDVVFYRDRLG
ncbi:hypothetical protein BDZ89DRAFT_1059542, partial [Hymenopellis radicata]